MDITEKIYTGLTKEKKLSERQELLLKHGINIVLCDGGNLLFTTGISFVFGKSIVTVLYLILFSILRSYSGGWHASTRGQCFLSFQSFYCLYILLLSLDIPKSIECSTVLLSFVYIVLNAPVEHFLNPLSQEEIERNRVKTVFIATAMTVTYFFTSLYPSVSRTITVVLFFDMIMMVKLKNSSSWRYHENQMRCR